MTSTETTKGIGSILASSQEANEQKPMADNPQDESFAGGPPGNAFGRMGSELDVSSDLIDQPVQSTLASAYTAHVMADANKRPLLANGFPATREVIQAFLFEQSKREIPKGIGYETSYCSDLARNYASSNKGS